MIRLFVFPIFNSDGLGAQTYVGFICGNCFPVVELPFMLPSIMSLVAAPVSWVARKLGFRRT